MSGQLPRVGLNLFVDEAFPAAAGPLFEQGVVDALEWDVDDGWGFDSEGHRRMPAWVEQLLALYSEGNALYGHGVWFSVLSARWQCRQEDWLENLRRECRRRRYCHLSEHFGFISAGDFARGATFPVPHTRSAVRIGRERLGRIADASGGLRVGLENTAVALCSADAIEQGAFLDELLAPLDGFLLFDLHNLWTQCRNLGLCAETLLHGYPLKRVREIHVSGGAWYQPSAGQQKGPFRLDSHDGPVPEETFALVPIALRHCPNVEVVIFEHRGAHLDSLEALARYRSDFLRLRTLVESAYE
jgi:uncharacterized protein